MKSACPVASGRGVGGGRWGVAGFWGSTEPRAEAGVSVQDPDFLDSIWDCPEFGFRGGCGGVCRVAEIGLGAA